MQIQIVSDLHNEAQFWVPKPKTENADTVLVVAGDICTRSQAGDWLATVANDYKAIVAVLGNHDYWDSSVENVVPAIRERISAYPNVHILDQDSVVVGDTRFVGCTLWTSVPPEATMSVQNAIKDFNRIYTMHGQEKLTVFYANEWHNRDKQYLHDTLSTPFDGTTVVVTHHAPSSQSIDQRYKDHAASAHLNHAYHTELNEWAIKLPFDAWIHGHTHHSFNYPFGSGRVICNPRGYWPRDLNPGFNEEYTVDSVALRQQRKEIPDFSYEDWWAVGPDF